MPLEGTSRPSSGTEMRSCTELGVFQRLSDLRFSARPFLSEKHWILIIQLLCLRSGPDPLLGHRAWLKLCGVVLKV